MNEQILRGLNLKERTDFEKQIAILKNSDKYKEYAESLEKGTKQTEDVDYYQSKVVGAETTIKLFKTDDDEADGLGNVAKAKVPTDKPFLLFAIGLEYSLAADTDRTFTPTQMAPALLQSDVELYYDEKKILSVSGSSFTRPDRMQIESSNFEQLILPLSNPKWFMPDKKIEFNLVLYKALASAGAGNQHQVKVHLYGIGINSVVSTL